MPNAPQHIAIAGYGTAGQAAALLLARDGHRVQVFERAPAPAPVGAGFLLQPTGMGVLLELGLLEQALAVGAPIDRLYGDLPSGRAIMDMRYAELVPGLIGLGMQRAALFELLHAAQAGETHHTFGVEMHAVDADGGRLRDAEGRWHGPFDLVLLADGAASRLRAALAPHRLDRPYPWGALWCLLPVGDWPHPRELRQRYRGTARMIGLLPVGRRTDDSTARLSFFWSLPTAQMQDWHTRGIDRWKQELHALWPQAQAVFDSLPDDPQQLARAHYRDCVLRRWHHGRVCAIGDAAHAMSPQLGQGVNMALLDALALRDALRAEPQLESALQRYAAQRRGHVGIYHLWSRWLTPLFQSDRGWMAPLRDALFLPLSRLPGSRGQSLAVLSGTQQGLLRKQPIAPELQATLARHLPRLGNSPR
jgi:2-polyprenyl-6-methoxyphenol hydroxylase-like FAD-dependent oxidoreductase